MRVGKTFPPAARFGGIGFEMEPRVLDQFPGTKRFTIRRRVGAGGMGVVYDAYDHDRDMRVALKTILNIDATTLYRFKKEFRMLADATHPNFVRLHELISEGDQWFFTMEYIEGVDFLRFVCPSNALLPGDPLSDSIVGREGTASTEGATTGPATEADSLPGAGTTRGETLESTGEASEATSVGTESATGEEVAARSLETTRTRGLGDAAEPAGSRVRDDATEGVSTRLWIPDDSAEARAARSWSSGVLGASDEVETQRAASLDLGAVPARASDTSDTLPAILPKFHDVRLRSSLAQLAEALHVLHGMGKLHRDIKPSNVMVTRRGRLVLLDFGLSTELEGRDENQSTTHGHVVGTVTYMAPEQAGGGSLSASSDWYSVGVMLYRALTGRLPFSGRSLEVMMRKQLAEPPAPKELNPEVPDDLNDLCVELLRKDAALRPDGAEVLRRLGRVGAGASAEGAIAASGAGLHERPFVGRERELDALTAAFAALRMGKSGAAFVHGRSGAGKSTLTQRFLDGLVERGDAVVLSGRCYEQESVAYKAIDTLIDSLTRFLRRLHRLEAEALLPRDVAALARLFPVLRRVDSIAESPKRSNEVNDPQELRRRAFGALRELFARIGDRKPLVLAIDDLQWGDADSAALLCELLAPPDPPQLLLVCGYRSEYAEHSPCLRMLLDPALSGLGRDRVCEIPVEPLTPDDCRDLALRLLGVDDELARKHARMIARESGGSPYFVYELVEHRKAGGEMGDRSTYDGAISLDDVLWERIGRLPTNAQALLEVLAVAGRPLRQANECRAADLGPEGFAALALLRSNHLVRGAGAGALDDVETYHDKIRETVVRHLPPDRLKLRHERLAVELESSGRADLETLAVHFDAAAQPDKAGDYYERAAVEATETLAFERAAALFRRALDLRLGTPRADALRCRLADALANAGRSHEAAQEYLRACESAPPEQLQELRRKLAFQLLISGRVDEGLAAYREVLAHVGLRMPQSPGEALSQLLVSRAILGVRGLKFRERDAATIPTHVLDRVDIARSVALGMTVVDWIRGSSFQSRSLLLALRAGEPQRVALSLGWEVVPSACQGKPAEKRTKRLIEAARTLSERLGDPHAIGMSMLAHGAAEFLSARFRAGLVVCAQATEILRERCPHAVWELDTSQIFSAWSLVYAGDIAELRARCPRLAKAGRDRGDRYLETTVNMFPRVVALLADDEPLQAREQMLESIAAWSQQGFHIQHLTFFYGDLLIDTHLGDFEAAWRRVQSTWPDLEKSLLLKIQHVYVDVLQFSARAALAAAVDAADPAPLLAYAAAMARRLDRERLRTSRAHAGLVRAGIAAVAGDRDLAARRLRPAVEAYDDLGMELFANPARRVLSRLVGGEEGRALLEQSDLWMRRHAVRDPERLTRCWALRLPHQPR